jgi:hypothetical protein
MSLKEWAEKKGFNPLFPKKKVVWQHVNSDCKKQTDTEEAKDDHACTQPPANCGATCPISSSMLSFVDDRCSIFAACASQLLSSPDSPPHVTFATDIVQTHNPPGDLGLEVGASPYENLNTGVYAIKQVRDLCMTSSPSWLLHDE